MGKRERERGESATNVIKGKHTHTASTPNNLLPAHGIERSQQWCQRRAKVAEEKTAPTSTRTTSCNISPGYDRKLENVLPLGVSPDGSHLHEEIFSQKPFRASEKYLAAFDLIQSPAASDSVLSRLVLRLKRPKSDTFCRS